MCEGDSCSIPRSCESKSGACWVSKFENKFYAFYAAITETALYTILYEVKITCSLTDKLRHHRPKHFF